MKLLQRDQKEIEEWFKLATGTVEHVIKAKATDSGGFCVLQGNRLQRRMAVKTLRAILDEIERL